MHLKGLRNRTHQYLKLWFDLEACFALWPVWELFVTSEEIILMLYSATVGATEASPPGQIITSPMCQSAGYCLPSGVAFGERIACMITRTMKEF